MPETCLLAAPTSPFNPNRPLPDGRIVEGPFPCLLIRGGQASECAAELTFHGAEIKSASTDPANPGTVADPLSPIIPYSEMTEVWHYGTYVHVRYAEGEARFDVGDRRRCKRIARMIEDAPS